MAAEIVFWACVGVIAFTYVGYPLLLWLLVLIKGKPPRPQVTEWPGISVLVAARNEEHNIAKKIANILANGYPPEKLEVIVCSDGSTDATNRVVEQYDDPRVHLAAAPTSIGVNEVFALGAERAAGEVLLLTDANAAFEAGAIATAAAHFADPAVGIVSGRIIFQDPLKAVVAGGYRSYWRIETRVRLLESHLGVAAVIVGAFELIRREAYLPVPSRYNNDVSAPAYAFSKGFRCRYEPKAINTTVQRKTPGQDFTRRARMALRCFTSLGYLRGKVPFFRNLRPWAALLCHKFLRYLSWPFMIGAFVANLFLLASTFFLVTFIAQAAFYGMALAGWLLAAARIRFQLFSLPFYFCLLQAAGLTALAQAIAGRHVGVWKPVGD